MAGMAERQKEWQNGRTAEMDTYTIYGTHTHTADNNDNNDNNDNDDDDDDDDDDDNDTLIFYSIDSSFCVCVHVHKTQNT